MNSDIHNETELKKVGNPTTIIHVISATILSALIYLCLQAVNFHKEVQLHADLASTTSMLEKFLLHYDEIHNYLTLIIFEMGAIATSFAASWFVITNKIWRWHQELTRSYSNLISAFDQQKTELAQARKELAEEITQKESAVSEWEQSRTSLIESSKMATLGEMAGGIAHEINNPVGIILLRARHSQMLLRRHPERIKEVLEFLKIIEDTGHRIKIIVRGLRTFARSGENDPFESAKLTSILTNCLELCGASFERHGVTLSIEAIPSSLSLECRPTQISQVILNLLSNARFAVKGVDKNPWVKVTSQDEGTHIRLCVMDSGKGIPKELQEKIMQPFFSTKKPGEGSGLGLSISKGIIESHRGEIFLDTACQNTCFVLILPKNQTASLALAS